MSVFYDEVKNCLKVPVDGLFEAYYVCEFNELNEDFKSSYGSNFAMRAAFKGPKSAYICYVNYIYHDGSRNFDLFRQVLKTFKTF